MGLTMLANDYIVIVLGFVIASIAVLILVWHYRRSQQLLNQWAARNGYQMLRSERRSFRRGPFFWTTSKNQVVYYVEVLDEQGNRRIGWVRCGGWWLGLLADHVEAMWET